MNIPVKTVKSKFLSQEMLTKAREHAAYLERDLSAIGNRTAVMIYLLVADIETYREAFKGAAITLNHAGDMLKRNDDDIREASHSLALVQLKCSVLFNATREALTFLDGKIADYQVEDGIEGAAALHAVADELRTAIEVARKP